MSVEALLQTFKRRNREWATGLRSEYFHRKWNGNYNGSYTHEFNDLYNVHQQKILHDDLDDNGNIVEIQECNIEDEDEKNGNARSDCRYVVRTDSQI